MKELSSDQKEYLEKHISKKPIEYIELYNELYDHYASAYENGELNFQDTLEALDQHFHYRKVKSINSQVINKSQKAANNLYWSEFKKFWEWPQIITTLAILGTIMLFFDTFPMRYLLWGLMIPSMFALVGLMSYPLIIKMTSKNKSKKLKSSLFASILPFLNFPITLFNISMFLPIFLLESNSSRIILYENYPVIPFTLLIVFLSAIYIGLKVIRTKIKIQYI